MLCPSARLHLAPLFGALALLAGTASADVPKGVSVVPADALIANGQVVELALIGDRVGAPLPSVRAELGTVLAVTALSTHSLRVRYRTPTLDRPATEQLALSSGARVPLPLRAAGRVTLQIHVTPSPLVLTAHPTGSANMMISVRDPAGQPAAAALRLGASIGHLSAPAQVAPGQYIAHYTPPADRYPQVALLVALSVTDGAFATAPLALAAPVRVDGHGQAGASMSILVNQRTFGPVTIDTDGTFALPIIVPPGGHAMGRSVDVAGNVVEREIDLHLPPFPRVLLSTVPAELPADGRSRAEVVAFSVDVQGRPAAGTRSALSTDGGTLGPPRSPSTGVLMWTLTAPQKRTGDRLRLRLADAHAEIALGAVPPFHVGIAAGAPMVAGRATPDAAIVNVVDDSGSPVVGATLSAQLPGGKLLALHPGAPGRYLLDLQAPRDAGTGHAELTVALERLRAGAPRRLTLHRAPSPAGTVAAEAWVDDDLGLPVSGIVVRFFADDGSSKPTLVTADKFGTARFTAPLTSATALRSIRAELAELPGVLARLDFTSSGAFASRAGFGLDGELSAWSGASATFELPIQPARPTDLTLVMTSDGASGRYVVDVKARDDQGEPFTGELIYESSGGTLSEEAPMSRGHVRLRFTPPGAGHFVVSVTDPHTRVSSFIEVDVP